MERGSYCGYSYVDIILFVCWLDLFFEAYGAYVLNCASVFVLFK